MLILTRKIGEEIVIGDEAEVVVKVLELKRGQIKLGIEAPRHIPVHRQEVMRKILQANRTIKAGSYPREEQPIS
jgi:carbon storage regulator